ncbi:hypothetical protein EBL_c36130 [Shimwellia blattae DSM 4481 = NBRC 105725]|uniref:Uncharacterized protein n=1 Tax=Shimwellia blattae (strain ATCC 29907 / DSM 4481 / JCM 1650 / NBRC 105725 / CDC 9005-74) TaxID=630626 RepID=I2BDR1_SHIBC|nr:hypothetical protein EBL_c36130 [Shimwellia blattae DSM 4481 = NBRC 105725]
MKVITNTLEQYPFGCRFTSQAFPALIHSFSINPDKFSEIIIGMHFNFSI